MDRKVFSLLWGNDGCLSWEPPLEQNVEFCKLVSTVSKGTAGLLKWQVKCCSRNWMWAVCFVWGQFLNQNVDWFSKKKMAPTEKVTILEAGGGWQAHESSAPRAISHGWHTYRITVRISCTREDFFKHFKCVTLVLCLFLVNWTTGDLSIWDYVSSVGKWSGRGLRIYLRSMCLYVLQTTTQSQSGESVCWPRF